MPPKPKPTRDERKKEKENKKYEIERYRQRHKLIAVVRDAGLCVFCWFRHNRITIATEVHHVYGRARSVPDIREKYISLLCTCRNCHPQPIMTWGGEDDNDVVSILDKANDTPINKSFNKAEYQKFIEND